MQLVFDKIRKKHSKSNVAGTETKFYLALADESMVQCSEAQRRHSLVVRLCGDSYQQHPTTPLVQFCTVH